jgi:hypothetical protein
MCTVLVGKHEGKKSLGRLKLIWEGNIQIDFGETGWECMY